MRKETLQLDCEICGRSSDVLYVVDLEGARMSVCERCSRGKSIVSKIGLEQETPTRTFAREEEPEEEVVEGYGEKIRKAREALGIPMKVLAERINEKESNLIRVENERTLPTEKLVLKLERELNINLTIAHATTILENLTFLSRRYQSSTILLYVAKI